MISIIVLLLVIGLLSVAVVIGFSGKKKNKEEDE